MSDPNEGFLKPIDLNLMGNVLQGQRIVQIVTGLCHTVALTENGLVFTWGCVTDIETDDFGSQHPLQVIIPCDDNQCFATQAALGADHTVVIVNNGTMYSWGLNDHGQLGDGTTESSEVPVKVLHSFKAIKVSAWSLHTLALDDNGQVYFWGSNSHHPDKFDSMVTQPEKIKELSSEFIVDIDVGDSHYMAVNKEGVVFTWGIDKTGELGTGVIDDIYPRLPTPLNSTGCILRGKKVIKVSAGDSHSVALDEQGIIYSWGSNNWGQLGNSEQVVNNGTAYVHWTPVVVDHSGVLKGKYITQISAGSEHTMAMSSDGLVFLFGRNQYYQLGLIDREFSSSPISINTHDSSLRATQIGSGGYHSTFLSTNGSIYSFGDNIFLQLGDGTILTRAYPAPVRFSHLQDKLIVQIASCATHSIVVTSEGQLLSWGENHYGQLGDGTKINRDFPIPVDMHDAMKDTKIVQVGVSPSFSVALSQNGQLFSWGVEED